LLNTGTDFSISASKPSPSIVNPGQSSTSTVTLNLLNDFDNPVSLACGVQPEQAGAPTCSLSSSSVTFDASGKASGTMTFTAGAALLGYRSQRQDSRPFQFLWVPIAGFAFVAAGIGRGRSRKRKLLLLLTSCFLFAGLISQLACGGSSSPQVRNYAITVTGTSGTTQHSATVTLAVQ